MDWARRALRRFSGRGTPVRDHRTPPVVRDQRTPAGSAGEPCSITVRAQGPSAASAGVFTVSLYGPGASDQARASKLFDAEGRAEFSGLPAGSYSVVVDARGDIPVGAHPSRQDVDCSGGGSRDITVEFG